MNNKAKAKLIRDLSEETKEAAASLLVLSKEVEEGKLKGNAALWTIYNLWTGFTYKAIEQLLRKEGAKSPLDK